MEATAMTPYARKYEQLQWELLSGRQFGTISDEEEDRILERMDDYWWKMPEDERLDAERRIAETAKIEAPKAYGLVDVEVPIDGKILPRKAA